MSLAFVGREVDDTVGDDHVDRLRWQPDVFDLALEELDVVDTGFGGVPACQVEHLVGHVQPVGLAGGRDPAGGEDDVDPTARAEIQDDLADGQSNMAVGLPQPSEAGAAASGSCATCWGSYRL